MQQVYKALYAFLSSICLLLLAILFVLITKDNWTISDPAAVICTALVFLMFPFYGKMCHHMGKLDERHRPRERIESTYQTEPHGIKYTRKAR